MSQKNVELSLLINEAWNRRDVEALALWDPEGVWYPVLEGITEGRSTYPGHAEIRQYFEDLAEFSEESHAEFPELRDLGDQVLGLGHFSMRFASGVQLDQEVAFLHTWRNGKCVEARTWLTHADAREAAGLRE